MKDILKRNMKILTVSVLLLLTVAVQLFIFSNSMKDGKASSEQSDKVVEIVRPPAEILLPIINMEPSDSVISGIVRNLGHFSEFALLGCFAFFTVRALTCRKWLWMLLPFTYCAVTACIDEAIQLTSPGRAWQFSDILTDSAGALCGMLFAFLLYTAVSIHCKKKTIDKK